VGLYYKSRWLNNTGLVELGYLGEGKCQISSNCSLDSNNKYNYYLSQTQEVSLVVLSDELSGKRRDFDALVDLSFQTVPLSNDMVTLYLLQMFFVLIISVIAFLVGMKYMVPDEEEQCSQ